MSILESMPYRYNDVAARTRRHIEHVRGQCKYDNSVERFALRQCDLALGILNRHTLIAVTGNCGWCTYEYPCPDVRDVADAWLARA